MSAGRLWYVSVRLRRAGHPRLATLVKLLVFRLYGAILAPEAELSDAPTLLHAGHGVVVHPRTTVGRGVRIFHGVTLGTDVPLDDPRHMTIGDHVVIGAGAVLIGPVTVGDRAVVGANAVVVADVPPDSVAGGNPARVIGAADDARRRGVERAAEARD